MSALLLLYQEQEDFMASRLLTTILILTLWAGCEGGGIGTQGGGGVDPQQDSGIVNPGQDGGSTPWWDQGTGPTPDLLSSKPEVCNGLDDDLDGDVDENCPCKKGATQKCFPGQASQLTGLCKQGSQTCIASTEFGSWNKCAGAVLPVAEICGDGIDQDCDGKDLACPAKNHCDNFVFGQTSRPVDIVWVIDQSGSMSQEIAGVRNNMNYFASQIAKAKVDYRVTVLAARYNDKDNHEVCIPQPLAGANCKDGPRFKQIDQHIESHDALTRIVQYINTIEGFMRKGSIRRIVAVTDDEAKGITAAAFHAFLKLRSGYSDYKFHSIVALVDKGCAADDGKQYIALSNLTGGIKSHICNANWQSVVTSLAKEATSATSKFLLKKKPKAGTIVVTFGGKPSTQGVQWTYDAVVNQVVLKQPYPKNGQQIKVCYQW